MTDVNSAVESLLEYARKPLTDFAEILESNRAFAPPCFQNLLAALQAHKPEISWLNGIIIALAPGLQVPDVYQASRIAQVIGILLRFGADHQPVGGAILDLLEMQLPQAFNFTLRLARDYGVKSLQEVSPQILARAATESLDEFKCWRGLDLMIMPVMTMLASDPLLRKEARRRGPLRSNLAVLEQAHQGCWLLTEVLEMAEDQELLVLHPESSRGFLVELDGVRNNCHMFTLLQDTLLRDGHLKGTPPNEKLGKVARGEAAAEGLENEIIRGSWRYYHWPALLQSEQKNLKQWMLSGELRPNAIMELNNRKIVLLLSTGQEVGWTAASFAPIHPDLRSRLSVKRELDAAEVQEWLTRIKTTSIAQYYANWREWLPRIGGTMPATVFMHHISLLLGIHFGGDKLNDAQKVEFAEILPALEQVVAANSHNHDLLIMASGLFRRLQRVDNAIEVAQNATRLSNCSQPWVMLGYAHREKGNIAAARDALETAVKLSAIDHANEPGYQLLILADLGDLFCDNGDRVTGLKYYEQILARDPQHDWAFAAHCYYNYLESPDEKWFARLYTYFQNHQQSRGAAGFLLKMVRARNYVTFLPAPNDATLQLIVNHTEKLRKEAEQSLSALKNKVSNFFSRKPSSEPERKFEVYPMGGTHIEAPSNYTAFQMLMHSIGRDGQLLVAVGEFGTPDKRKPRGPVEYLLWDYEGPQPHPEIHSPRPVVPAPHPAAINAVAELASSKFNAPLWLKSGAKVVARIGHNTVEQLLGVMVHPLPMPDKGVELPPWAWLQHMQVAAAMAIANLDEGWQGSLRRRVLLSIANGPMDWTVSAALIALTEIARTNEEAAAELAPLFNEMLNTIEGPTCYEHTLAYCLLRLPNISAAEREEIEKYRDNLES